ncbi:hypothetical protein [Pseudomonas alkylphenolica]|uniref:hypothetical protein n=1 Tax=Pseudomonas alkylphenolica TaxID=237609 RepID=UPI00315D58B1
MLETNDEFSRRLGLDSPNVLLSSMRQQHPTPRPAVDDGLQSKPAEHKSQSGIFAPGELKGQGNPQKHHASLEKQTHHCIDEEINPVPMIWDEFQRAHTYESDAKWHGKRD